ncbi:hypothetical protein ABM34_10445 [Companilactobacillus ginsenosidimutans]|uniref:Uncharacterized protein n=1 Tax=Companilactobacillus ginsenosidimutans TaxID=1007676 RepID=A0A0H4QJ10_9LACO|nr:hypothetical protein ABM34_10445 [Companilactobacillus ginsenosidimutans]
MFSYFILKNIDLTIIRLIAINITSFTRHELHDKLAIVITFFEKYIWGAARLRLNPLNLI